ncbi:MAG: hypothetical protein ACTHLK_17015 [Brucella intermedia]
MLIFSSTFEVEKINIRRLEMELIKPKTIIDDEEIESRLAELELERNRLIAAGYHALASAATASPLHPSNAKGMLSYLDGVKGLRAENLGGNWEFFRRLGVEGIRNDALKLRVLFANVTKACGETEPKAISRKGAGSQQIACGDLFDVMGLSMPLSVVRFRGDFKTYYLMVDAEGAMELSLPVVTNKQFQKCIERIFLIQGGGLDSPDFDVDEPRVDADLDVVITRR